MGKFKGFVDVQIVCLIEREGWFLKNNREPA